MSTQHRIAISLQSSIELDNYLVVEKDYAQKWIDVMAKPVDPGFHTKIKGKHMNIWGIPYAFITFTVVLVALPFMMIMASVSDILGNKTVRFIIYITILLLYSFAHIFILLYNIFKII